MKRHWFGALLTGLTLLTTAVWAETETIDLKALAKKARPAVMLLVVSDAAGKEIATGTGFLVSSDGKLITNHHVIENAASAVAKAENGGKFEVEGVLADDPKNDLVLLKLSGKNLPFLNLGTRVGHIWYLSPTSVGTNGELEVGARVAIIGSPLGLEGSLSEGIVSAIRKLSDGIELIQTTAPISPGSSGSPVLNAKGDVVGVASALLRGGQALNFAVPVECASRLLAKSDGKLQALGAITTNVEDAIFSDPDWRAAVAAETAGDYVETLKRAKLLVARYPENGASWWRLGCAFGNLKFTDDEITAFRQVIKIKPDLAEAWYNLGIAYGESGRTDDAIAAYRQSIKLKPDDADLWASLGNTHGKAGRTDDAIAAYRQAIKIKPDDATVWYGLGVTYCNSGRTDDAISACQQAIKIKPDSADPWNNLAVTYGNSGRTDDAIEAYRQAIKIKPDDARAWYNLGNTYFQSGRTDEAIAAYRQAIKLKPNDYAAWHNLGVVCEKAGRADDAHDAFRHADNLKSKSSE